jgi:hypothetical protein
MLGYMEKGVQTSMAQCRSTAIIEMIKWIRTSRLSIKKCLSCHQQPEVKYLPRFSPLLIRLEGSPLRGDRSREIELFESLDMVHIRLLVVMCRAMWRKELSKVAESPQVTLSLSLALSLARSLSLSHTHTHADTHTPFPSGLGMTVRFFVEFDLIDRMVGVGPYRPQARIRPSPM